MKRTTLTFMRLVVALILVCWGADRADAQQAKGKSAQTLPAAQATARRNLTIAQRRAAAARNTARKLAAGQRNQAIQRTTGGKR